MKVTNLNKERECGILELLNLLLNKLSTFIQCKYDSYWII